MGNFYGLSDNELAEQVTMCKRCAQRLLDNAAEMTRELNRRKAMTHANRRATVTPAHQVYEVTRSDTLTA